MIATSARPGEEEASCRVFSRPHSMPYRGEACEVLVLGPGQEMVLPLSAERVVLKGEGLESPSIPLVRFLCLEDCEVRDGLAFWSGCSVEAWPERVGLVEAAAWLDARSPDAVHALAQAPFVCLVLVGATEGPLDVDAAAALFAWLADTPCSLLRQALEGRDRWDLLEEVERMEPSLRLDVLEHTGCLLEGLGASGEATRLQLLAMSRAFACVFGVQHGLPRRRTRRVLSMITEFLTP